MERVKILTSTLVATLLYFTSIGVEAKVLSCEATKGDGLGWIPSEFQMNLANDRKTARVISPITEAFGAKPFKKSFIGSDLWSRGKGKSKSGDYYNYQFQLGLDSNDTYAKIVMKEQGYKDIEVEFLCSENIRQVEGDSRVKLTAQNKTVPPCSYDTAKELEKLNPQSFYVKLKLGLIDLRELQQSEKQVPDFFSCLDKFRGNFPPIREFIRSGAWKKPLTVTDCKIIDYKREIETSETLAQYDPIYRKSYESVGGLKEKLESCESLLQ